MPINYFTWRAPVRLKAIQWDGIDSLETIMKWTGAGFQLCKDRPGIELCIRTTDGVTTPVDPGDWVIEIEGEFCVFHPEDFIETFARLTE